MPLTDQLLARLAELPLTPVIAWGGAGSHGTLRLGLGDRLSSGAAQGVWTVAGGAALGSSVATLTLLVVFSALGILRAIPVMTDLGPVFLIQWAAAVGCRGTERTTAEYLREEGRSCA